MGLFGRKPAEVSASGFAAPSSLNVNSLSGISERLSEGDTIKTLSFWICFIFCASLVADLAALLVEKYLPSPPVSRLASRSNQNNFAGPINYEIIIERNLFSSKAEKKAGAPLAETTAANTLAGVTDRKLIHPGVLAYWREAGLSR